MVKRYLYYLFLIILLFFIPVSLVSRLRDNALLTLQPLTIFLVHQHTQISNLLSSFGQISNLRNDKQDLQQEVARLQQELTSKKEVGEENETLRKELGVTGVTRSLPKVLARVIIQGNNPTNRTLTVDVGATQGLKEGQPAIYQGFLIGRVLKVREHSAIIQSITSRESRIQARIADNQERGLLVGDGNAVSLTDLTQGIEIKENSQVETSGLGGSLPQGILIGKISSHLSKESDLSQSYLVTLPQNPTTLNSFLILLIESP